VSPNHPTHRQVIGRPSVAPAVSSRLARPELRASSGSSAAAELPQHDEQPDHEHGRTWDIDIVNELRPAPGDRVLYENRDTGFYRTELETVLRERGVTTLIVVGATTSVCVDSTVSDAEFRDLDRLVLEDCTAEPIAHDAARSNHEATLDLRTPLLGRRLAGDPRATTPTESHRT